MKFRMLFFFILVSSAAMISCSDDEEAARKGDPDITHEGVQWNIASVDYTLIDQSAGGTGVGQTYKAGSKENAGTFYFVEGEAKGSFEMNVEGYNKEDAFNYSEDAANHSISIITIDQSVGATTNQNVLALNGDTSDTEKTLSGTIVKQSTSGQFILTVEMTLVKK